MITDLTRFRGIALSDEQIALRKAGKRVQFNTEQCAILSAQARARAGGEYRVTAPITTPEKGTTAPEHGDDATGDDNPLIAAALRPETERATEDTEDENDDDLVALALRVSRRKLH